MAAKRLHTQVAGLLLQEKCQWLTTCAGNAMMLYDMCVLTCVCVEMWLTSCAVHYH